MSTAMDAAPLTTIPTTSTTSSTSSTSSTRNVRCLIVGNDFDLASGSFALTVDENLRINQLTQQVLRLLPSDSHERIGSELQLFKGFDLYTDNNASTPTKPRRKSIGSVATSPIEDLLKTTTPEKTANKYFQRKYAMRQRASLDEYLPRGRKCESSRIDVLISMPKFQLRIWLRWRSTRWKRILTASRRSKWTLVAWTTLAIQARRPLL